MTKIPQFTDKQIEDHLIYLDALVATKKVLHDNESAQRMTNIAAIIRQLRDGSRPKTLGYCSGFYVGDIKTRRIKKCLRLRDAAEYIGFTMSAISLANKHGYSLGARYFVSRTLEGVELLLQNQPVRPAHHVISKIQVTCSSEESGIHAEYTTARDFRKAHGVSCDVMSRLLTKRSGTWQDLPHHPGHRVAIWYRK